MSSIERIESSRANGRKSRGPVTAEGKEISSRNAKKHGLFSTALVMEGESEARFADLYSRLMRFHAPQDEGELIHVENMIMARWRHMRIVGIATAEMSKAILRQAQDSPDIAAEAPAIRAASAFKKIGDESRFLDHISRLETRMSNLYDRNESILLGKRAKKVPLAERM